MLVARTSESFGVERAGGKTSVLKAGRRRVHVRLVGAHDASAFRSRENYNRVLVEFWKRDDWNGVQNSRERKMEQHAITYELPRRRTSTSTPAHHLDRHARQPGKLSSWLAGGW